MTELTCALCGWKFSNYRDFKEHVTTHHRIEWKSNIPMHRPDLLPYNASGRDKKEIVREAEQTWLAEWILQEVSK